MRLLRRGILLGVARPDRQAAEPQTTQQIADRTFGQVHAPLCFDLARQIDPTPAHHPIRARLRTRPHPARHHRRPLGAQLGDRAWRLLVRQTRQARRIVANHPVAQALPIHPAGRRRLMSRAPFQDQRQRQHPPRRRGIRAVSRRPAQPDRIKIASGDLNRSRHPIPQICPRDDRILQNLVLQPLRVAARRRWYNSISVTTLLKKGKWVALADSFILAMTNIHYLYGCFRESRRWYLV